MPYVLIAKVVGGLLLIVALTGGFFFVKHKFDLAAQVPQLKQEVADRDARIKQDENTAAELSKIYQGNEAARVAAEQAYNAWENGQHELFSAIRKSGSRTAASTNSVCFPTAADRQLRNSAFGSLGITKSGQAKSPDKLPARAGGIQ